MQVVIDLNKIKKELPEYQQDCFGTSRPLEKPWDYGCNDCELRPVCKEIQR